ncbi:ribonuclease inhibitor-like [Heterodontus francisci]|uniref:ribonuclease inhibitor-like n=1 Tax=Heterodontus francisci TaxID=7792 RepID=UPI00355BA9FC
MGRRLCEANIATETWIRELTPALSAGRSLTHLDLSKNDLRDVTAGTLFQALRGPGCKIEKLWVCSNRLTHRCCPQLALNLQTNPALKDLNLNDNYLGDSGVATLSRVLKETGCKIQKLGFWNNGITDTGCKVLTSALGLKETLTHLDLADNRLTDNAVPGLTSFIRCSIKLESIRLAGNRFSRAKRRDLLSCGLCASDSTHQA